MAIPSIQPYRMPVESELPANRVDWRPDPDRAVLLIHDMQRYFLRAFPAGRSPVLELVENIRALRERCAARGVPVVYSAQPGAQSRQQRGLQQDFWGDGVGGADEQRIVDDLAPGATDVLLTKWRYSAFQRTDLADLLRDQGRDQLVITGIYGHIGCLMTAAEAFMRDIQVFLVADAVADFSAQHHRMALDYVAQRCGVTLSTRAATAALAPAAPVGTPGH
ncbi:isochorismatase family protein [Goodfellowiella coeruleoviolacea]|uniref:Bifunctional isochorismate lyase / aryl carrier protein n=1 Tax=Goodfellowiella coeruleoviolacea TaxID=334858 RepID=A0AAE3GCW2_9PSEU|nr:isochorismatase family protein [Goodfellowiella coeruleoviolacea]MCP2163843.1 bifunctional isochorismate lyase / aryl carrier protein [Goodfellowiella coeruleoviolacea]